MRYANNLLKNPATKRLSGKKVFPIEHADFPASYVSLPEGIIITVKCLRLPPPGEMIQFDEHIFEMG